MTKQNKAQHLKDIVGLLNNQQFITESRDYWDSYRAHAKGIGPNNKPEWERQGPAFMSKFLDPFMARWMGAHPLSDELLSSPLWQKKGSATMTGRWGIIPVYPWTTEEEVKRQTKQIQKSIGKKHTEFKAYRLALIAKWLLDSYISTQTNKPPGFSELAAAVWGREEGFSRLSKEEGSIIYL